MRELGKKISSRIIFDRIYVSPLERSKQSAEEVMKGMNTVLPIAVDPELREIDYGIFDGKDVEELDAAKKTYHAERPSIDFTVKYHPSMESYAEAARRYAAALMRIAAKHPNETIGISGHNGVIKALLLVTLRAREFSAVPQELPFGALLVVQSNGKDLFFASVDF